MQTAIFNVLFNDDDSCLERYSCHRKTKSLKHRTTKLSGLLCGSVVCSFTVSWKHRLRALEKSPLKRTFEPKRDKVGDKTAVHNDKIHNL